MIQFSINNIDQSICAKYSEHESLDEYFSSLSESELLFIENKLLAVLFEKKQSAILGLTDQKNGVFKDVLRDMVSF